MENKILKIGMLVLSLVIVFSYNDVNADTVDNVGPQCLITNTTRIKLFRTAKATVSCYEPSGLQDSIIQPSDFTIGNTIFNKAKVVAVSNPYISFSNPNFIKWDIEIKGFYLGSETIQLRKNVISDIYGNQNAYSPSSQIRVVLF